MPGNPIEGKIRANIADINGTSANKELLLARNLKVGLVLIYVLVRPAERSSHTAVDNIRARSYVN